MKCFAPPQSRAPRAQKPQAPAFREMKLTGGPYEGAARRRDAADVHAAAAAATGKVKREGRKKIPPKVDLSASGMGDGGGQHW